MKTRSLGLAVLAIAATAAPASAANDPIRVHVRVEGKTQTLFDGNVLTKGHAIDAQDGTGPHKCDGTNNHVNATPGPTVFAAFDDGRAKAHLTWAGKWFSSFEDFSIARIGPDSSDTTNNRYWGQVVNYKDTDLGGCQQQIKPGDDVVFAYDSFGKPKLKLTGPKTATVDKSFVVKVIDGQAGKPFKGAKVGGGKTNKKGLARVTFHHTGGRALKASATGAIRSNRLKVKVRAH
ncbi:MAG: hypothetical protein QOD76_1126 [Solirubrobacteraceae bacterium]|jgi:hypothetical protein|nr:hypothetical protein [Solirubrobacteraceae bacterium]MEA2398157.1 hypothetical protein [Thermoleophilaceae bacterium]